MRRHAGGHRDQADRLAECILAYCRAREAVDTFDYRHGRPEIGLQLNVELELAEQRVLRLGSVLVRQQARSTGVNP